MKPNDQDPFEDLLRKMQPADPDPQLRERIARTLNEQADIAGEGYNRWSIQNRLLVGLATAAVVALAGLVVLLVLLNPGQQQIANDPTGITPDEDTPSIQDEQDAKDLLTESLLASVSGTPAPTWFELTYAYRDSPERVTELLDRYSADRLAQLSENPNPVPSAAAGLSADLHENLP